MTFVLDVKVLFSVDLQSEDSAFERFFSSNTSRFPAVITVGGMAMLIRILSLDRYVLSYDDYQTGWKRY